MMDQSMHLRRLVQAAMFAAIATALSYLSVPVGPTRVFPFQATVNAVAGVLLGPWYAAGAALVTACLRNSLHTGTVFAFPGSVFGALTVGYGYRLWKNDAAAFFEPIGTALIGATVAWWLFQGFIGSHRTLVWFVGAFAIPSVTGCVLGYLVLRALRRVRAVDAWRTT